MSACVPLLAAGATSQAVVRYAAPAAIAWLTLAAMAERAGEPRRAAFAGTPRATCTATLGLVLVSAAGGWAPGVVPLRPALFASALVLVVLSVVWERELQRVPARSRVVVALGAGADELTLLRAIDDGPSSYHVAGVVGDAGVPTEGFPLLGSIGELDRVLDVSRPDVIVVGEGHARPRALAALVEALRIETRVVGVAELYERTLGRAPLPHLSPEAFVAAFHLDRPAHSRAAKRAFDLVVASLSLACTAPLLLLIAALVRQTPGPVIYRQIRQGQNGRLFTIYKFRTMVDGAEPSGSAVWAQERDPRVTWIGSLLRRTRLDELPQLWNVLTGTMSIVGPRPERPEHNAVLGREIPLWSRRALLKPGITGWAQINHGYAADAPAAERKLAYDLWYLGHHSLLVDLAICMRTAGRLTRGAR